MITRNYTAARFFCVKVLIGCLATCNYRLGPKEGQVPPRPSQRSVCIMMYLRYCSFRKGKVNGLTSEDVIFRTLYRRGPTGFIGMSNIEMFDE